MAVPPGLHYTKGVVQRVVYDVNDKQKVVPIDLDETYELIAPHLGEHDAADIKARIRPMVEDKDHDYGKWDILERLRPSSSASASSSFSSSTPSSSVPSSIGEIRTIGERDYQPVNAPSDTKRAIYKYDDKLWHIKASDVQRSYAEEEYIGATLYAAITGQSAGDIELHYEEDADVGENEDDRGLIVKRHLLGYRNWADSSVNPGTDYDATGLGQIAVAAWFLGDADIHGANFGTLDAGQAPQLAVVDASGALNEENLAAPLKADDYLRLPLPPSGWNGRWDLHHRELISPEDTTGVSLPTSIINRLRPERRAAVQRILLLDFNVLESELAAGIFQGGESPDSLEDVSDLKISEVWKATREALELRKKRLQAWVEIGRRRLEQQQQGQSASNQVLD